MSQPLSLVPSSAPLVGRLHNAPPEYVVTVVLLVVFALLAVLSGLTHTVRPLHFAVKVFDVATENNIWTWTNVLVLGHAASFHATTAVLRWRLGRPQAIMWLLSAAVVAGCSLDDFMALHERTAPIGRAMGGGEGLTHFPWILPGMIVGTFIIAALMPLMLRGDRVPRRLVILATVSLFTGAIVMESVSGLVLSWEGPRTLYILLMHVEELLEAVGAILFLAAGIADVRTHVSAIAFTPVRR